MSSIAATAGALLTGTMLATFTCGMAASLGFYYHRAFPHDRWQCRALALAMLAMALVLTLLNIAWVWRALIENFGNPYYIAKLNWTLVVNFPVIATACYSLQFFLAYRAWILSGRSRGWAVYQSAGLLLSTASWIVAIYFTQWYARQEYVDAALERGAVLWVWWALQIGGEAAVTASLIYWVIINPQHKTKKSAEIGLAHRFALRAAETNLVSLAVQFAILVLFAQTNSVGMWFATISFSIPPLYTVSLLLALLSRASEEATFAFEATNSPRLLRAQAVGNRRPAISAVDVRIEGEVEFDEPATHAVDLGRGEEKDTATTKTVLGQHWPAELDKENFEMVKMFV